MPKRKDKDGLYQRPDSTKWWATFVDGRGKRTRRSTGTEDRKEAEALLAKWKLEAHQEKMWEAEPSRPFDELMLEYLNGPSKEKQSHQRDLASAKRLFEFFSGQGVDKITPKVVREYVSQRKTAGVGPATINRELSLLSKAYNWSRTHLEWNAINPVPGMKLTEPPGRLRWIEQKEAEQLLKSAMRNPPLHSFILLGLSTGMRSGELVGLEWKRVDMGKGEIYLDTQHQKSKKRSIVPINEQARKALVKQAAFRAEHCPDSPWVFAHRNGGQILSLKKGFAAACQRAGIENFTPHDMRHTVASWLVQDGVPIRQVCELLRHSSITVTMRYAHLAPKQLQETTEALASRFSHV